jgi:thioredoxin reductase (NADPH)
MLDMIIIGGGPGGLSAGLYASRGGLNVALYEIGLPGGQIITSSEIENYPGYIGEVSGTELMEKWPEQAKSFGLHFRMGLVQSVVKNNGIFDITLDSKEVIQAKSVILATGSVPKKSGFKGENTFFGKGVSTCATCDGFFYKNKEAITLGGGDTALEEALFLSNICSKVYLVHRREEFRAAPITIEKVLKKDNIEILYNSIVEEAYGSDTAGLEGVKIKNKKTGNITDYPVPVIFVFVGRDVLNKPIINDGKPICDIRESGEVIVDLNMKTSLSGLYAIGDVRIDAKKQVVCAAGDGATASVDAIDYVHNL